MKKLLFIDDERNLENVNWIQYPEYEEVQILRRMADFTFAVMQIEDLQNYDFSFDHDLQDFDISGKESTGYDCIKWLCDYAMYENIDISKCNFYVHTKNPVGKKNIESYIANFIKFYYT